MPCIMCGMSLCTTVSWKHSILAGPRRPGEGTEDDVQGIVDVQETNTG